MIKSAVLLCILFVGVSSIAIGQDTAEWKRFAGDDDEFSFEFPVNPKSDDADGMPRRSTYWEEDERTRIFVVSEPLGAAPIYDQCLRIIGNYASVGIELGSLPAKRFTKSDGDFVYSAIAVQTDSRAYFFLAVAPAGNSARIDRFLNSIRIDPKPASTAPFTETTAVADPSKPRAPTWPTTTPGADSQDGRGSLWPRTDPADPNARPETDTAGLRILSKPRPTYTEAARLFRIEGEVTLRVTFSADGTIGAVSTVSKLPFGLNETAIGAARSIRFVPARRDGKAYSVVKTLVYSFWLY